MNLLFRMLWIWWRSLRRPPLTPLDTSIVNLRVLPTDLDMFMHMNNSRYLALMDLGRLDLILRLGMNEKLVRDRWTPIVATARMRYRRPLLPFQRYLLHTRLVYWDEKWFYVEQKFIRGDEERAVGWVKGLFRDANGNVVPAQVMESLGYDPEPPTTPDWFQQWKALEEWRPARPGPDA